MVDNKNNLHSPIEADPYHIWPESLAQALLGLETKTRLETLLGLQHFPVVLAATESPSKLAAFSWMVKHLYPNLTPQPPVFIHRLPPEFSLQGSEEPEWDDSGLVAVHKCQTVSEKVQATQTSHADGMVNGVLARAEIPTLNRSKELVVISGDTVFFGQFPVEYADYEKQKAQEEEDETRLRETGHLPLRARTNLSRLVDRWDGQNLEKYRQKLIEHHREPRAMAWETTTAVASYNPVSRQVRRVAVSSRFNAVINPVPAEDINRIFRDQFLPQSLRINTILPYLDHKDLLKYFAWIERARCGDHRCNQGHVLSHENPANYFDNARIHTQSLDKQALHQAQLAAIGNLPPHDLLAQLTKPTPANGWRHYQF